MSDKVYFMNNGVFDVRAMTTFGVSAKEDDDAIGYFGTGFKYAVAIVLRLGGSITVESAGETFEFERRTEIIREQEFDIVYVNGAEAGFTTRLGVNWEPWMAFRELYCNAADEDGCTSHDRQEFETIITVNCPDIATAYRNKSDYILDSTPIHSNGQVEIHDKRLPFIYYRGIAVHPQNIESKYSYNITSHIDLTEDRTAKHTHQHEWAIRRCLQATTEPKIIRKVVRKGDFYENQLGFDSDWHTSDEFVRICNELMHTDIGIGESARLLIRTIDEKNGNWPEFTLTKVQLMMLDKAIDFLNGIGVTPKDYEIRTVQGLGDGVMGRALDGVIYLSEIPFHMGTKQLASTLLEEWVHNKTGAKDFDRKMQSWLFDKILSMAEEHNEQPL